MRSVPRISIIQIDPRGSQGTPFDFFPVVPRRPARVGLEKVRFLSVASTIAPYPVESFFRVRISPSTSSSRLAIDSIVRERSAIAACS